VELRSQVVGSDGPETLDAIDALGRCYLLQGHFDEAEPLLRDGLAIRERVTLDDWRRFRTGLMLGEAILGQKRFDEAETFLSQSFAGLQSKFNTVPPEQRADLKLTENRIARLYESLGRKDKASQWRMKAG
jgi:hypothetical protein